MNKDLAKPFLETLELWSRGARKEEILRALQVLILSARPHFHDSKPNNWRLDDIQHSVAGILKTLTPAK